MTRGEVGGGQLAQLGPLSPSTEEAVVQFYFDLAAMERVSVTTVSTVVLGVVVLGLVPEYSDRTVRTVRASPMISLLVGAPAAGSLLVLLYVGQLLSQTDVGVFFGIPFVVVGLVLIPAGTLVGIVALGSSLASRIGHDGLVTGLLLGALLAGGFSYVPYAVVAAGALAMCLGVGAGMRVLVTGDVATDPSERTVPPANEI